MRIPLLALLLCGFLHADDLYEKEVLPLLEVYCYDCHGDGSSKGDFSLEIPADGQFDNVKHWEAVWRNVRSQVMPPSDKDQPELEEKRKLMAWIERSVFKLDPENPDPGRVTIRRLNRTEYRNAVDDLFKVRFDTDEAFPADDTGEGFDTIGAVLSISPLLMEKYLAAAVDIAARAVPESPEEAKKSESFKQIFFEGDPPDDPTARAAYAGKIVERLATRAFRRPPTQENLDRLTSFVTETDREGKFTDGVRLALTAILASPHFLFRAEVQPEPDYPGKTVFIDEFALASRLSFFLWSSVPDQRLLELAAKNELRQNLGGEVDRMLKDWKAERFTENFTGQWLELRNLEDNQVDSQRILGIRDDKEARKIFSWETKRAMRLETEKLFSHILAENRPAHELLDADYTFVDKNLARLYGLPEPEGKDLVKIDLRDHPERGGLLTHGSFLLVTSNPTRTSPVKRGLFVLENLLGTPPPPAPPAVPELEESAGKKKDLTMREMMAAHRDKPDCRGCHARMDPIGLGLENYNALGQFREKENGHQIDPAGQLVTGEKFSSVAELKDILANKRRADFHRCLAEKLLTYALGRGMDYHDSDTVAAIVTRTEQNNGSLREMVLAVIESPAFQKRRGDG